MITVFSGGTGTPKLLQGIKELVVPEDLTIVVNTLENDYFSGVYVAADIDTVLYTLTDMINEEFWYGVSNDTFITNERLAELGTPELLKIGDIDRSTKIQKTLLMKTHTLSEAVNIQSNNMGIHSKVLPMSDEDSEIKIVTDIGELDFHDFLIKYQCEPNVLDVKFSKVSPAPEVIKSIKESERVIIGPSNPITSVLPILSLNGVCEALKEIYVVAISPIIGTDSVSGPASKFMSSLGIEVSAKGVASLYSDFLDCMIIDTQDKDLKEDIEEIIKEVKVTNTIMKDLNVKTNLANIALNSSE